MAEEGGDLGDHLRLGLGAGDAQVAGLGARPAGVDVDEQHRRVGDQRLHRGGVGEADGVGRRHDDEARVQQQVRDLAEPAHQLGLRGVDPQVVIDAEEHVLTVEHVDVRPASNSAFSSARA